MGTAAFDQIGREIPHLRRYAKSLTHDPDRAEDLVQDVLVRGMARIDGFRPNSNLRTWMFAIMYNLFIDQCRQSKRRGVHVPVEDWMHRIEQPAAQMWNSALGDLANGFDKLNESEQAVLFLVGFEGLKYEEAAKSLGIAVGTVKSRLSRARATLRGSHIGYPH